MLNQITPAQLSAWGEQHAAAGPLIVLDVREPWELQTASVKPAGFELLSIPMQGVPARLSEAATAAVCEAAVVAHETLGLSYLSRIDFIIDDDSQPIFLEANALPGLTETSSAPLAIEASGVELGQLYEALARAAAS